MKRSKSQPSSEPECSDEALQTMLEADEGSPAIRSAIAHVDGCSRCQIRLSELAAEEEEWADVQTVLSTDEREIISSDRSPLSVGGQWHGKSAKWTDAMAKQLLSPASHPEMLGRIGRYEVERLIGSGGMGVVFKASDSELNRPVAVKVLAPHLADSGAGRKRFAREARAAAAVVHEHVVSIHNVETDSEVPFLVMQYVAGESLQQRMERVGPLQLCEILRIGMQTASGLSAAHAQGLVHRDVKPANIMLEHGVDRALLTDFGLARASDDASLTRTGYHPGTPQYMSPEQVRGDLIDQRSDLFSLGSVIYAMCTGRPPFRAESSFAVLRRITDTEPRSICEVNSDMPLWLDNLVQKLLAKDPVERFQSADEIASVLQQCLAHVQQPATVGVPECCRLPRGSSPTTIRGRFQNGIASMKTYFGFRSENQEKGNRMVTSAHRRRRVVALGIFTMVVASAIWFWPSRSSGNLLPIAMVTGELRSGFERPLDAESPFLGADPVDDARRILEHMEQFWKGIDSFRVKQSRRTTGSEYLKHSVLVAERPNKLMLRYVNWPSGRGMVSDGDTVRVGLERDGVASSPEDRFYLEAAAPDELSTFLKQIHFIGPAIGHRSFADEELMPLLPFIADAKHYWMRQGLKGFRLIGTEQIRDLNGYQVSAYHLKGFGFDGATDPYPHLWITSEGAPLLVRASCPSTPFESVTYTDWVLNPKLPNGVFNQLPTFGYKPVKLKFTPPDALSKPLTGTTAPELKMQLLDGSTQLLSDLRGEVCVLDFWATWCGPCLKGLPIVQSVCDEFSEQGVKLFAVTSETDIAKIRATLKSQGIKATAALDIDKQSTEFGVTAVPHLVVIDRKGIIRVSHTGYVPDLAADLRKQLQELVGE